jgi:tetratricopeptide (TPR) repeat protein
MGRYHEALLAYEQAAAFAHEPAEVAEIEHRIAQLNDRLGDWAAAEAHLEGALALVAGSDDHSRLARLTADLALVNHRLGRGPRAGELGVRALTAARCAGDQRGAAQALNVQGMVALAEGRTSDALAQLEQAVEAAATLDDPEPLVAALNNVSRAQLASAELDGARETAARALEIAERQGDRHRCAALHSQLADVLHAAGDEAGALEHLKASAAGFSDVQGDEIRAEIWTLTEW